MKNCLVLILLLSSINLFGQNYMFEYNTSGYSLGGQYFSYKGIISIAGILSYTSNGKLTIALGIGNRLNDNIDGSSPFIQPSISFLLVKQGKNTIPISLGINGVYQYNTFTSNYKYKIKTIGYGASLHHEITANKESKFILGGAVGWSRSTSYFKSNKTDSNSGVSYSLLCTMMFNKFYFEPSFLFSEEDSVFSLSFGFLFPKKVFEYNDNKKIIE